MNRAALAESVMHAAWYVGYWSAVATVVAAVFQERGLTLCGLAVLGGAAIVIGVAELVAIQADG